MTNVERTGGLPRLLDRDDPPPLARLRWYWRYVHRWRKRLFNLWRREVPSQRKGTAIAPAVDDLIGLALLLDYFRRSGFTGLPTIRDVSRFDSRPSVAGVAAAIGEALSSPILRGALEPGSFANSPSIPHLLFRDSWERRIGNATWLLYRDKSLPLSLFGDFHQVCVGNPLNTPSSDLGNQGTRRARGMYYTPAPIVDYLVSAVLDRALADRNPDDVLRLRILDPSCGCGAFLIGCLRYLIHWLGLRLEGEDESVVRSSLKLIERVLHGCDIDLQAVRWTIRLLLLATWEGLKSQVDRQSITGTLPVPVS